MFSRANRLPHSVVLRTPKQFSFSAFRVTYKENGLLTNRYGFVVGKRIDKRAVVRNRTKRVLRSEVELIHSGIKPGIDFLFVLTKKITKENNKKTREDVKSFFRNEGLFNE